MVTIFLPATVPTGVTQARTTAPSTCTVHAPHCAMPHPYFVPASLSSSRSTQSRGISDSTSRECALPLTFSLTMGDSAGRTRGEIYCMRRVLPRRHVHPRASGRPGPPLDRQLRPITGRDRLAQDLLVLGEELRVVQRAAVEREEVLQAARLAAGAQRALGEHEGVVGAARIAVLAREHLPGVVEGARLGDLALGTDAHGEVAICVREKAPRDHQGAGITRSDHLAQ